MNQRVGHLRDFGGQLYATEKHAHFASSASLAIQWIKTGEIWQNWLHRAVGGLICQGTSWLRQPERIDYVQSGPTSSTLLPYNLIGKLNDKMEKKSYIIRFILRKDFFSLRFLITETHLCRRSGRNATNDAYKLTSRER